MSVQNILSIGAAALRSSGTSLSVAANNVANAQSPGYARQSALTSETGSLRQGGVLAGRGVEVSQVVSSYDRFAQLAVLGRVSDSGGADERARMLRSVDASFSLDASGALGDAIDSFFDSFATLEADAESSALRLDVRHKASLMNESFHRAAETLSDRRSDSEARVGGMVAEVNDIAARIAQVSDELTVLEAGGDEAHDLRAQRTALLEQLAEYGPVRLDGEGGDAAVLFNGHTLVAGGRSRSISNVVDPSTGQMTVRIQQGGSFMSLGPIPSGRFAAAMDSFNAVIPELQDRLDTLASEVIDQTNAQHQAGFGLDGVGGRDFFAPSFAVQGAASTISLDAAMDDLDAIAAASDPTLLPAEGGNAAALNDLASKTFVALGGESFSGAFGDMLSSIGQLTQSAETMSGVEDARLSAAVDQRDSVAGVSLEEEALDLVRFQEAYQAATRVISAADEMMKELMRII